MEREQHRYSLKNILQLTPVFGFSLFMLTRSSENVSKTDTRDKLLLALSVLSPCVRCVALLVE